MYPVHWFSEVPFQYMKNGIKDELHRAKKISSNFQSETARIKAKFLKAGFPHKVIENTINNFNKFDKEHMIPRQLFDERKTVAIDLPFSNKNEYFSKKFCKKLEFYTNGKKYLSCVIYQRICSCGHNYIGEIIRNTVIRIDELPNT